MKLLANFYKLIDIKADGIENFLREGRLQDATIEVHALKNTARMVGAQELSAGFFRLEQYGTANDRETFELEVPGTLKLYRSYKSILKPFVETDDREKREVPPDEIILLLREIILAMKGFNLDDADAAVKELETMRLPAECGALMDSLAIYVEDISTEKTNETAEAMIKIMENQA